MPDQETRIRLLAVDDTANALKSASQNFYKLSSQLGKTYEGFRTGAEDAGKVADQTAKKASGGFAEIFRSSGKAKQGFLDVGEAAATLGTKSSGAFKVVSGAIESGNAALLSMAGRYMGVAAAVEIARRAFMGFANIDDRMRIMQNQAGATREEIEATTKALQDLAVKTATPIENLIEGFDQLREGAGLSLEETEKIFPKVAMAAKAMGTSVEALGSTTGSMMRNMNVAAEDVGKALDSVTKGVFDLRLNAEQLTANAPKLSEAMSDWGYAGADGVARMTAFLGSLQKVTGDTGKSAMGLARLFENMGDPAISQALGKTPEGLRKTLRQAQKEGKDVLGVFVNMIASSKNRDSILEKFSARERSYIRQLIKDRKEMGQTIEDQKNAEGTAGKGFENRMEGARQSVDKMIQSLSTLSEEFGALLHSMGATTVIKGAIDAVKQLREEIRIAKEYWDYLFNKGKKPPEVPQNMREWSDFTFGPASAGGIGGWVGGKAPFKDRFEGERKEWFSPGGIGGSVWKGQGADPVVADAMRKRAEQIARERGLNPEVQVQPSTGPAPTVTPAQPSKPVTQAPVVAPQQAAEDAQRAKLQAELERKAQERLKQLTDETEAATDALKKMSLELPEAQARIINASLTGMGAQTGIIRASLTDGGGGGMRFAALGDGGLAGGGGVDNTPIGRAARGLPPGGGGGGIEGTQVAPPGQEGQYRPQYKLGDADLSDAVVNTVAGEALRSNQSTDAVINTMMNRLGTKAYGPSGNLAQVARAPGQFAGYQQASPERAAQIRERIKAIAAGTVPDETKGANEFRAGGYSGPWGQEHRDAPVIGGNRFAYNPKSGKGAYAPYAVPKESTTPSAETQGPTPPAAAETPGGGGPAAAVDKAMSIKGAHEGRQRALISEYLRTGGVGMDPKVVPWCAAFVNSSLQQAGIKGTGSQSAASFKGWGEAATGPVQKGDVIVGKGSGPSGYHVGMATGRVDPKTGKIEVISGNTADSVTTRWEDPRSSIARRATAEAQGRAARAAPPSTPSPPVARGPRAGSEASTRAPETPAAPPAAPTEERQINVNYKVNDSHMQFARGSMERQFDSESRRSRWNSYADTGYA